MNIAPVSMTRNNNINFGERVDMCYPYVTKKETVEIDKQDWDRLMEYSSRLNRVLMKMNEEISDK